MRQFFLAAPSCQYKDTEEGCFNTGTGIVMEAFTDDSDAAGIRGDTSGEGDVCQPVDWLGATFGRCRGITALPFLSFLSSSSKREAISWARMREEKDTIYPGCLLRAPGPLPLSNGDERQAFGITERRRIAMEQRAQEELFSS